MGGVRIVFSFEIFILLPFGLNVLLSFPWDFMGFLVTSSSLNWLTNTEEKLIYRSFWSVVVDIRNYVCGNFLQKGVLDF